MANISNYGSGIISEDFEQTPVMDFTDNEISSDSNIIPYSQYLQETQQATVQDTNLQAQQDSMILSVIEQIYKERVKTFEQRLNIDLSSREKMIDSQMDDMIREKLALKEQIDSLEQNLSKQIKEKESLFKTFSVFKNESKEKENKYMENEIDLEKKIKELDNIVYKVGQSAHTPNEDFETRFSPQQELSAEQAFWFHTFNPTIEPSYLPPVMVDVPSELPKVFKDQFDSIKQTRVRHKEQCDSLINKQKLKIWKEIVENVVHIPSATTIAPGMFKLDLVPLPPRLLQNREVHIDYLRHTQEQANTLREIVKQAKVKQP
ncbi:hypothetical protein Tco_1448918 [Tanacetum coccineum]